MDETEVEKEERLKELVKERSTETKLDLSNCNLNIFPKAYPLTIRQLHLKNNQLRELPGSIFGDLVNLVWLDVRNNKLERLPSQIGESNSLRDILLGGNELRELPQQLVNIPTLTGLQIHPNEKLVSPPSDIIKLGFKEIIGYLSQLDAVADEDTISELSQSVQNVDLIPSKEYKRSFQNKILPISLKNPMSLDEYEKAMDKHLKAEEKPLRLKQWDEMTDEDKLDRSIEQSMINKELQKRQDQEKLKDFRKDYKKPLNRPKSGRVLESERSDIKLVMDHDANRSEMDKKNAKNLEKFHNRGEIGILPSTGGNPTAKESILDNILKTQKSVFQNN